MVHRVVVEIESADGVKLEEPPGGVRYRVLRGGLWGSIERVRKRCMEKLGGLSSLEEY